MLLARMRVAGVLPLSGCCLMRTLCRISVCRSLVLVGETGRFLGPPSWWCWGRVLTVVEGVAVALVELCSPN